MIHAKFILYTSPLHLDVPPPPTPPPPTSTPSSSHLSALPHLPPSLLHDSCSRRMRRVSLCSTPPTASEEDPSQEDSDEFSGTVVGGTSSEKMSNAVSAGGSAVPQAHESTVAPHEERRKDHGVGPNHGGVKIMTADELEDAFLADWRKKCRLERRRRRKAERDNHGVFPARGCLNVYHRPHIARAVVVTSGADEFTVNVYDPAFSFKMGRDFGPILPGMEAVCEPAGPQYVIPRGDTVVCGGTYLEHQWSLTATESEKETMMFNAAYLMPGLIQDLNLVKGSSTFYAPREPGKDRKLMAQNRDLGWGPNYLGGICGLRPVRRAGVLCERNAEMSVRTGLEWFDNFGHGNSGWTICWACAEDLAAAVLERRATIFASIH